MSEWISVEDRLPKRGEDCLARISLTGGHNITEAHYKGDGVWVDCWCTTFNPKDYPVHHWMPLPEPPTQEITNE